MARLTKPVLMTRTLHRFFRAVSAPHAWAVMLGGSAEPSALNRWCIIGLGARQTAVLQGNTLFLDGHPEPIQDARHLFDRLEMLRQQARRWTNPINKENGYPPLPMSGGLAGMFGYDFHRWCDLPAMQFQPVSGNTTGPDGRPKRQQDDSGNTPVPPWTQPEAILCEFEDWLLISLDSGLESGRLFVLSDAPDREAAYHNHWRNAQQTAHATNGAPPVCAAALGDPLPETSQQAYRQTFTASFTPEAFSETVEQLRQAIGDGEMYQANLSLRLRKQARLDPAALFERLCLRNPSPFAGFFKWPGGVVVSSSPERLVQVDADGAARTRPIAGTRGRGRTTDEDDRLGAALLTNAKERAEHLMLVDLARNDLGCVSHAGSVAVEDLLTLERYSHVTHLVSNVRGQLRPGTSPWEVLAALFPGGTITGCPKRRCMEILDRVESVRRGFYTGSLGYIDAETGAMDFNILIRSVFLRALPPSSEPPFLYHIDVHAGAGIVYDAVGAYEYRECLRKASALLEALEAVEQRAMTVGCARSTQHM